MELTSTTSEHVDDVSCQQKVSGWSIFWALFAIVSHAMLQTSFTGYLWNSNAFEGSFLPHRSSPFVCLVDAAADVYMSLQAFRNHDPDRGQGETSSGRNGALTRLVLFGLGVMPQAIKLFSMQGIPRTQAIAAMFLLSSTISLIRSLMLESPQQDIQKLLGSLNDAQHFLKVIVHIFGWAPSLVGIVLVWYGLVDKVGFAAPADIVNAVDWVCAITISLATVYILQHSIFVVLDRQSPVSGLSVHQSILVKHFILISISFPR